MAPRPRHPQQRLTVIHQSPQPRVRPQIANLIDYDAMQGLGPAVREMLGQFLGSFLFIDFCKIQVQKAEEKLKNLRPSPDWTQEEYLKLFEEMQLVWRFWKDLEQFGETYKQQQQ